MNQELMKKQELLQQEYKEKEARYLLYLPIPRHKFVDLIILVILPFIYASRADGPRLIKLVPVP